METIEKKGNNKKIAIITGIIVALIIAIVAGTFMVQATPANKVKKQLQLAQKYLDELDYDKALAAYKEAIQIDPRCEEAYLAMADIYIKTGDEEKAMEIIEKGQENIQTDAMTKKLQEVKNYVASAGQSGQGGEVGQEKTTQAPTQATTEAATQKTTEEVTEVPTEAPTEAPTEVPTESVKQAEEYLDALEYEKAQEIYEEIIKNDPSNADAYLGLVEVYIRQNQYDKALEIAQKGYEATKDERLNEKIKMLQSGNVKDSRNNVMKTSYYDGDGNLVAYHEYTYNEDNKKASIKATFTDGREPQIINYEYDSDGNSLVGSGYDSKTFSLSLRKYEYSNGKMVKGVCYEDTTMNEIDYTFTYKYENDLLAITSFNRDGVKSQFEYTYDSNGKMLRCDYYYMPEHTLSTYFIYEYDSEGKTTKYSRYRADGSLSGYTIYEGSVTKEYDASGNLISESKTE